MRTLKKLWKFLCWLEDEKIKSILYTKTGKF